MDAALAGPAVLTRQNGHGDDPYDLAAEEFACVAAAQACIAVRCGDEVVLDSHCIHTSGMRLVQAIESSLYQLVGHQPASKENSRATGPVIKVTATKQQATQPLGKAGPAVKAWQVLIG